VALLILPQRVLDVFFAHWAFSLFERNIYTAVHAVSLRLIVLLICCRVHSLRIVQLTMEHKLLRVCLYICISSSGSTKQWQRTAECKQGSLISRFQIFPYLMANVRTKFWSSLL
jgi:hypothetical protein